MTYKRLIEVDLPIKTISGHARREKSVGEAGISMLHTWWARRPLAACRAVILAALWPDPADPECPIGFRNVVQSHLSEFARKVASSDNLAQTLGESAGKWIRADNLDHQGKSVWSTPDEMRRGLLDFIGDASAWELSNEAAMLNCARGLTNAAYENQRPLVVDSFAGGGAIPLEALRMGADSFASDLNPVAVILDRVVLQYIPKFGNQLALDVRKWASWIQGQAEKELARFYPKDEDGNTPIAYLWARTIQCEGPGCGAEVPLIRSLWLAKKGEDSVALRLVSDKEHNCVEFEIVREAKTKEVGGGTVKRGSATCPLCGYTTPIARVREQLQKRNGGTADARLFCVVTTSTTTHGRFYRLPTADDLLAEQEASQELKRRVSAHNGALSLVPSESTEHYHVFVNRGPIYGMRTWADFYLPRQALTLTTLIHYVHEAAVLQAKAHGRDYVEALQTCLAIIHSRMANSHSSLCYWNSSGQKQQGTFVRQALAMSWDFCEAGPFAGSVGSWRSVTLKGVAF